MNGWLLYTSFEAKRNSWYIQQLLQAAQQQGIRLTVLLLEEITFGLVQGRAVVYQKSDMLPPPDFAICRFAQAQLTKHLELMGIRTFNNSHVSAVANDKYATYQLMTANAVPMLDTWMRPPYGATSLVHKPVDGKGGQDVRCLTSAAEIDSAATTPCGAWLFQAVASEVGRDLRVYVLGTQIVAAMLRQSDTEFRSNFTLGGKATPYVLSNDDVRLVSRVTSLCDFGLVGIDFLFHHGQLVLNEIEDVVGARMLYAHTDIDIAALYLAFIREKIAHEA